MGGASSLAVDFPLSLISNSSENKMILRVFSGLAIAFLSTFPVNASPQLGTRGNPAELLRATETYVGQTRSFMTKTDNRITEIHSKRNRFLMIPHITTISLYEATSSNSRISARLSVSRS